MNPWLGVWRRIGIRSEGFTHLVIERDQLWEVWPRRVFTEGDPGPERKYVVRGTGPTWEIDIEGRQGNVAGLLAFDGDRLRITLGIDDRRPAHLDDVVRGSRFDVYERETDEATRARLATPPPRVAPVVRRHSRLGELTFVHDIAWWSGRVKAGVFPNLGDGSFEISVALEQDGDDEDLDAAVRRIERIDLAAVLAKASADLLDIHNTGWRAWSDGHEDHEGPVLDAAQFEARLTLRAVTVESGGAVSLWFDDGDLFWGHDVRVELDQDLVPLEAVFEG